MKNVEDIYPLTPMQELMLLGARGRIRDDLLFNQSCLVLDGVLDADAFRHAWQCLTDRHAALRTAFLWKGLKRPMQVVRAQLAVPFEVHDWRALAPDDREARLLRYREDDRAKGFDLSMAPLQRIALFRFSDRCTHWVWSSHHLIIDRWCISALFEEFSQAYANAVRGNATMPVAAPGFGRYVAWVQRRDRAASLAYWRDALGDLHGGGLLTQARHETSRHATDAGERSVRGRTDGTVAQALGRFARAHGLTMSTVIQAGWALVVNHYVQCRDVVFGITVSGRPAELRDVEAIVGSFVNNVPVVWRLGPDERVVDVLQAHQLAQQRRQSHDHLALPDILACSRVQADAQLLDTLLVWLTSETTATMGDLAIRHQDNALRTAYPLTLTVAEHGEGHGFELLFEPGLPLPAAPRDIMDRLLHTLGVLASSSSNLCFGEIQGYRRADDGPARRVRGPQSDVVADADGSIEDQAIDGREGPDLALLTDILNTEWAHVLGLREIDPDADFFALGGDSIKAVRLHARVTAATRSKVPLMALFESSTIRQMASAIHAGRWPLSGAMATTITSGGDDAPLFCIASPEVNTIGYALLARHLQPNRPVYVIQAPPGTNAVRRMSPSELPALAQLYVEAIRQIQLSGPYRLLGMCVGSQIAVEVTRTLESRGEAAGFLGIINTWGYFTVSRLIIAHRAANRLRWYRGRVASLAAMDPDARWRRLRELVERKLMRVKSKANAQDEAVAGEAAAPMSTPALPDPSSPTPRAETVAVSEDEWLGAMGRPAARAAFVPIRSPITVLRIDKQPYWRVRDRSLGWRLQTTSVSVVDLPIAEHLDILREPHVRLVARQLDTLLAGIPA